MLADINAAAPRSVFLLHACAHLSAHVRPGASALYVRGTGYAYQPPACCTYQRRRAAGAPPYVRCTRTSLRRAVRTAYRGTTGERVEVAEKGRLLTQEEKEREKVVEAARSA